MDTRKHARKPYYKLVFFTSESRYHKGFINNISFEGVFIETDDKFAKGEDVKVFIPGPRLGKGAIIYGEVAHFSPKGIGLKFKKNAQGQTVQYL
jgi:Tfp pilus assembly protein PilZ